MIVNRAQTDQSSCLRKSRVRGLKPSEGGGGSHGDVSQGETGGEEEPGDIHGKTSKASGY